MKAQKKLNVVLIVLVVVLISIISFAGIYHLDKNQMLNMLPNYMLGTNIKGYRKVTLEVKGSDVETGSESITLGESEENTEESTNETSGEQEETKTTVTEEDVKNYATSAQIIKARLKR